MEQEIEHSNDKKDKRQFLKRINSVRKHKKAMLPYDLLGENRIQLTSFGRVT